MEVLIAQILRPRHLKTMNVGIAPQVEVGS